MAFFDEDGRKRSCSAEAQIPTEVIEVSFTAFGKAIENLNPWFKTIITTLAERLRKTNQKVRELESNSVSGGYGGNVGTYKFLSNAEIIKILSTLYLVMKSHAELKDNTFQLHYNSLKFYAIDIYNNQEAKLEAFLNLLSEMGYLEMLPDKNGLKKIISMENISMLREQLIFFNTERTLSDDKKMKISDNCEILLGSIIEKISAGATKQGNLYQINLSEIIDTFKAQNKILGHEDLADAVNQGFCQEPLVADENTITVGVSGEELIKKFPVIQLLNALTRLNESKAKTPRY